MKADRLAGIATAAAGLALAAATARVDILDSQPTLSARFFPYLLAAVLLAGGLALALRPGAAALGAVVGRLLDRRGLAFAALFLAYALTFRIMDFRLGTFAFMAAAMWVLGSRRPLELLVLPAATAAGVYVLFRYGFTVLLPVWF
ncbi:MAG: tripartite tricarboxylate transporter TctB family protein [Hyphomicrobiales bacterium]|nr:tripartite tricarboxylate transporter TctB family protein [Hyphomicrobiales bacterium]